MDISKTHLKQAYLFLNSSIIVQIPAFIFILYILIYSEKQMIILVAPFLFYSLFLFQNYLLNYKRFLYTTKKMAERNKVSTNLLTSSRFLLYFSKEESELLLFHPSGHFLGKIKKTKKKYSIGRIPTEYLLVDDLDNYLAYYYLSDGNIDVIQNKEGYIGHFSFTKNINHKGEFMLLSGTRVGTITSASLFLDDQVLNAKQKQVLQLKKGWMSLDSQEIFGNPNTPVLSVSSILNEKERLLFFSMLIKRYF